MRMHRPMPRPRPMASDDDKGGVWKGVNTKHEIVTEGGALIFEEWMSQAWARARDEYEEASEGKRGRAEEGADDIQTQEVEEMKRKRCVERAGEQKRRAVQKPKERRAAESKGDYAAQLYKMYERRGQVIGDSPAVYCTASVLYYIQRAGGRRSIMDMDHGCQRFGSCRLGHPRVWREREFETKQTAPLQRPPSPSPSPRPELRLPTPVSLDKPLKRCMINHSTIIFIVGQACMMTLPSC